MGFAGDRDDRASTLAYAAMEIVTELFCIPLKLRTDNLQQTMVSVSMMSIWNSLLTAHA